jgi:hypothetical protein
MIAAIAAASCSVPKGADQWNSSQVKAYADRSVQIMALAAAGERKSMAALVAPEAAFSLGSGDAGRPLGKGVDGAVAMAADLKPATYSYTGWDYIPAPRDVCGAQDVEVEFTTTDGSQVAYVKFHYDHGLLQSAEGWWHSRFSGPAIVGHS